jgi:hypothetical protein
MMNPNLQHLAAGYDVCVVGGGMAGLCAAVASARSGAKTVLVHDRPVLGGNASSEVRMWICGAHGPHNKETGILEEIQLANCHRNSGGSYSLWDSVLYEKAAFCPGLTLLLNTTCCDAGCEDGRIEWIRAWQMTTQTWHTVHARIFIDCSGDSILSPLTRAPVRWGRESRHEFGEPIEPEIADRKTMGNTLLLQIQKTSHPRPYIAPRWAYRFDDASHFESRIGASGMGHNYWWLELGGLNDTIADAETIRHELMCAAYGIWDYFRNTGPAALRRRYEEWDLAWVGQLPGKRENRRYVGPHILTQNDIEAGGQFDDIVAYGGWSMDDHHPAGLFYDGPPTVFHPAPSPYGIPYRCLYSTGISNLMFAGRNISVTHAALSSTRVMATTSLLGQAAGTAAALCLEKSCAPAGLYPAHIGELQKRLLDADCWLPGKCREHDPLVRSAKVDDSARVLFNGHERPLDGESNAWEAAQGTPVELTWDRPHHLGSLRLVLDSDLNHHKRLDYRHVEGATVCPMPRALLRAFRVEARRESGAWETVYRTTDNHERLVRLPLALEATALRLVPESSWGDKPARIFSLDVAPDERFRSHLVPAGRSWSECIAAVPEEDLRPAESENKDHAYVGA